MLALTSNAQEAIEALLSADSIPLGAGLRIAPPDGVDGADPGQLLVTLASLPTEADIVIDEGNARIFLAQAATMFLDDKVLDARLAGSEIQFTVTEQTV